MPAAVRVELGGGLAWRLSELERVPAGLIPIKLSVKIGNAIPVSGQVTGGAGLLPSGLGNVYI
jgi:hypothetical protein